MSFHAAADAHGSPKLLEFTPENDHAELFVVVAVTVRSDRLSAVVPLGMILPRCFKPANQADWRKALWQDLFRRKPILTRLAAGPWGPYLEQSPNL
jgi:hypothetical protein